MTNYTKIKILFSSNTLLQNALTKTTTSNITRHMANRDKLYGVEEGHATQKVCSMLPLIGKKVIILPAESSNKANYFFYRMK